MKKKVLYIEDEKNQLDLMMEVLGMGGYDVYGALDGLSGIKAASEKTPDIILLDLILPKMSGWEVITKLQGDNKLKNIPIVVITGDDDSEGMEKSITAGSSGFLKKPLDYKTLPRIISDYIEGKKETVKVTQKKREVYLREHSHKLVDRLHDQIESLTKANQKMAVLNKELERRDVYINNMLDPLMVLDLEGNIMDYNLALENYLKILLKEKSVTPYEKVLKSKNGDKIYTIGSSKLISDENGGAPYIEGSITDITERKLIDKEREVFTKTLEEKNKQLKEANLLKDEFLANMSHELRTPLNSIIGFSEVLVDGLSGELNEEQFEFINNVRTSGLHLLDLINDILDLSKIRAGMMNLNAELVELISISKEIYSTLKTQAEKKQIDIIYDLPDEEVYAEADPLMIKQILLNIVGNAIKFTPEKGEIKVNLREVQVSDWDNHVLEEVMSGEGNAVRYQLIDTGIGIEEANIDIVFDEFRQVDGSYTRNNGGTGLGLPLSLELVTLHGGKLWVESEVNVGSCFSILLPKKLKINSDSKNNNMTHNKSEKTPIESDAVA